MLRFWRRKSLQNCGCGRILELYNFDKYEHLGFEATSSTMNVDESSQIFQSSNMPLFGNFDWETIEP